MSNMIPMAPETNGINGAWWGLEKHLAEDLVESGKKLHVVAGGHGSLDTTQGGNTIPEKLWKVAVVLEPNQTIHDIDASNDVIAVILPNDSSLVPDDLLPDGTEWAEDGSSDGIGRVSINQIEQLIGGNIDLLNNLPNNAVKSTLKGKVYSNPYLSGSLLADSNAYPQSSLSEIEIFNNTPTGHNSVFIDGITVNIKPTNRTKEIGISKNSSSSSSPGNISSFQISPSKVYSIKPGIAQISPLQISSGEVGIVELSPFQISPSQTNSSKIDLVGQTNINEVSLTSSIPFSQFFDSNGGSEEFVGNTEDLIVSEVMFGISPEFIANVPPSSHSSFVFNGVNNGTRHNNSPVLVNNINNTAIDIWSDLLQPQTKLDIDFQITDLPSGQLAEATITGFNSSGKPNAGTILIDHDANGVGWFIDETPLDNSEFINQNSASYFLADPESAANGKYDLLTTVLHELAHLYGFIEGYAGFDNNLQTQNNTTKFIGNNFTATLDGEHLDKQAHPNDLLNTHLAPGVRKLPSQLNVEILKTILAFESEKIEKIGEKLDALLTADPLLGIVNGDFSIADNTSNNIGWQNRGDSIIANGQAVLTEDSPFLSNFSQTFTIPEDANNLQFTLVDVDLANPSSTFTTPPDSFEVALLDPLTLTPLVNTDIGLTETDALLNIQNDGTTYFSNNVRIGGVNTGEIIDYTQYRTISIDISHLAAGTEATLYFDLLGFGAVDSHVVIDDVKLTEQIFLAPITTDDTANTDQGRSVIIDILSNDLKEIRCPFG